MLTRVGQQNQNTLIRHTHAGNPSFDNLVNGISQTLRNTGPRSNGGHPTGLRSSVLRRTSSIFSDSRRRISVWWRSWQDRFLVGLRQKFVDHGGVEAVLAVGGTRHRYGLEQVEFRDLQLRGDLIDQPDGIRDGSHLDFDLRSGKNAGERPVN